MRIFKEGVVPSQPKTQKGREGEMAEDNGKSKEVEREELERKRKEKEQLDAYVEDDLAHINVILEEKYRSERRRKLAKKRAIKALAKIDPSMPYGPELFGAIARVSVSVAFEAVAFRINNKGGIEVNLRQRESNDPAYPGLWHCPGSVMRSGESFVNVFSRLSDKEFGMIVSGWRFVDFVNSPEEERGHFLSLIFLVNLDPIPRTDWFVKTSPDPMTEWFPVDQLPENIVDGHRDIIIPRALKQFKKDHGLI